MPHRTVATCLMGLFLALAEIDSEFSGVRNKNRGYPHGQPLTMLLFKFSVYDWKMFYSHEWNAWKKWIILSVYKYSDFMWLLLFLGFLFFLEKEHSICLRQNAPDWNRIASGTRKGMNSPFGFFLPLSSSYLDWLMNYCTYLVNEK